jgi:hypothetical protein
MCATVLRKTDPTEDDAEWFLIAFAVDGAIRILRRWPSGRITEGLPTTRELTLGKFLQACLLLLIPLPIVELFPQFVLQKLSG